MDRQSNQENETPAMVAARQQDKKETLIWLMANARRALGAKAFKRTRMRLKNTRHAILAWQKAIRHGLGVGKKRPDYLTPRASKRRQVLAARRKKGLPTGKI